MGLTLAEHRQNQFLPLEQHYLQRGIMFDQIKEWRELHYLSMTTRRLTDHQESECCLRSFHGVCFSLLRVIPPSGEGMSQS